MSRNLVSAALAYAARGWLVLPLHTPLEEGCSCGGDCGASAGKHPRTRHGLKEASRNLDRIWKWWRRWPDANIGILTGSESRIVVLDVDARHDGERSLEILEATYDRLPPTLTAHSGGGGRHIYFQHPGGHTPTSAQLDGLSGLDIRGDGGYIVAPPSLHQSGQSYSWVDDVYQLAALPSWLCGVLSPPEPALHPAPTRRRARSEADVAFWLRRALERARPGTRNVTGYWLACRLREAGVATAEARAIMLSYAAQVSAGDHPYQEREALASLRSAYQHAPDEPASPS
jgi:hypothetical protein